MKKKPIPAETLNAILRGTYGSMQKHYWFNEISSRVISSGMHPNCRSLDSINEELNNQNWRC